MRLNRAVRLGISADGLAVNGQATIGNSWKAFSV